MPSERMQRLNELKAEYEAARASLESVREDMAGDPPRAALSDLDAAQERLGEADLAYRDGLYEMAPGMSGDDRTSAAVQLKELHDTRWEQDRDQARADERAARERIDDLSQDFTVDSVESYQGAVDRLRGFDGPEAGGWDWGQDRGERGR